MARMLWSALAQLCIPSHQAEKLKANRCRRTIQFQIRYDCSHLRKTHDIFSWELGICCIKYLLVLFFSISIWFFKKFLQNAMLSPLLLRIIYFGLKPQSPNNMSALTFPSFLYFLLFSNFLFYGFFLFCFYYYYFFEFASCNRYRVCK